jgi:FkbM family methyltransferase
MLNVPPGKKFPAYSQEWLNENSGLLWDARFLLEDDLSKLLFDTSLVLKATSFHQFFFPRIDFDDFVSVLSEDLFQSKELPHDYAGLPLKVFKLLASEHPQTPPLTIVSTKAQVILLNSYRQYLVRRHSYNLSPGMGDVVLDCGACIGEISMLFAGLVGNQGEVHLFDPVPLHVRYCKLQASLNPSLAHVFHINELAVGDSSRVVLGDHHDASQISPGGLAVNSYSITTLDDYASEKALHSVDVIKMDIEGAEMAALVGAANVIREFKPRLAISSYHKPEDLWEIPHKLKELNGGYKLFFGHHSPIEWESVYYAV